MEISFDPREMDFPAGETQRTTVSFVYKLATAQSGTWDVTLTLRQAGDQTALVERSMQLIVEPVTPTPTSMPEPTPTLVPIPTLIPDCDPAYPTVCIPPPPPDLDCEEIPYRRFEVLPPDPHKFDRDRDGIGCELTPTPTATPTPTSAPRLGPGPTATPAPMTTAREFSFLCEPAPQDLIDYVEEHAPNQSDPDAYKLDESELGYWIVQVPDSEWFALSVRVGTAPPRDIATWIVGPDWANDPWQLMWVNGTAAEGLLPLEISRMYGTGKGWSQPASTWDHPEGVLSRYCVIQAFRSH
jgi:hypothetical protein